MAPSSFWVSAFLALNYGLAQANPMADAMAVAPVATMTIQPVKILTELPVIIRTHCPRPTKIVICHGKTLTVHRPGLLNTVITLTYEETQTRSRLNCGRRTSKTTTPASSAPAIETTSESPGWSGPITSVPTSSTESVSPGSFTTSSTSENVPEISEPGSIPSDSKTGDRYESASNSASSPPRLESSQLSPSSRINIDTAESQSSQTPLPSATTKTPHGDYSDVPEASVSEASSSVVSLSDGSYTAASATVRSESIGSTDRAASLQTSFPSTYGEVPGASVSEASSSAVSLSDGSNTATSVEARTKAGPLTTGSVDRVGSSKTPFSSGASKTYSDYGEVPGASISESGSSVVSLSGGSRTATSATVRSESIGSADRSGSSQNPFPSTYGDVPGASVSEASSSVVSVSDGSHTATSVTVRSESIGTTDRAGSSQTSFPSTHSDVPGASVSVASPSVNSLSDGPHTATTVQARKKVGPQTTGSADRSGSSETPFSSGTSKTYSDYGDVPGASVSESVSSVVSLSDGSRTATSANVRSESIGSTDRAATLQTSFPSTHGDVSGASVSESGSSNSVTSSSQKDSVGPSSSVSSVTVQAGSASSLTLQSDRDLPSSSKGPVLSTPSALERVEAGTSSFRISVSTLQTEKATPTSSSKDDSTPSNFATSSSPTDKPSSSSSSGDVMPQLTSGRSSSYGLSSFDSSAMLQPSSARSLSAQSDSAQPSSSQGATLLTPSALDKVQAGTSSSGANVSASSTFSTLLTQDARPSSSSNDDSIQSNSAPRSSSVVGGSISTTDTIHDSSSQTTRVPASKSSGTAVAVEISQSDQSTSASAQSLSRGIPAATSSNVDASSSNVASSDTASSATPSSYAVSSDLVSSATGYLSSASLLSASSRPVFATPATSSGVPLQSYDRASSISASSEPDTSTPTSFPPSSLTLSGQTASGLNSSGRASSVPVLLSPSSSETIFSDVPGSSSYESSTSVTSLYFFNNASFVRTGFIRTSLRVKLISIHPIRRVIILCVKSSSIESKLIRSSFITCCLEPGFPRAKLIRAYLIYYGFVGNSFVGLNAIGNCIINPYSRANIVDVGFICASFIRPDIADSLICTRFSEITI
ncbi:hypothetical protein E4U40_003066 [Claviceps sp. LM458 group G5]|nr:hypothetical protein E4U40_003066 [Claviceps sp. LM458 group G5]